MNNEIPCEIPLDTPLDMPLDIEALDKQIHEYWLENVYMSYALDCVDCGVIESVDALVKRPVSNAKLLTQRYRRYKCKNLEEKDDLKWFEEAIRGIKEMWEQIKNEGTNGALI